MADSRTTIRKYVHGVLLAGSTTAGSNVFDARVIPLETTDLPAIEVHARSDSVLNRVSIAPMSFRRELILEIKCLAKGSGAEDAVNTLSEEVETLILPDHDLGGNAEDITDFNTTITIDADGSEIHAEAAISFTATYISEHPFIATNEALSVYVDWDVGPEPDAQIEAQDIINLPQLETHRRVVVVFGNVFLS